jgi:AcrR family transcriptional regulator
MSTLRDRVRDALASADSTEDEAREDLEAVLHRARRRGVAPRAWAIVLVPALTGAAFAAYFAFASRARAPAPAASAPDRGVHLYVREISEPEDHALAIDIIAQGEH